MAQPIQPVFHDRERELERLEAIWRTDGAQLVTVWGRRRTGKSALLSRFTRDKRAVYLYGTRFAESDILENLSIASATAFDLSYLRTNPFPSWRIALDFLAQEVRIERTLVIFDEFSFLCDVTPGLDTLVQQWWDLQGQSSNVVLVIAGSAFSFMADLTGYSGALHGRRTSQLTLDPFDYLDSARFFPHLDAVDRVRAYACFGGIPAYLRYWRHDWSLEEAIRSTLLNPSHFLFREGEDLLRTEFHQEALYASILRAVADGERRPSDIGRAVGGRSVSDITDNLRRLLDLQYLRREVPITEIGRMRSQRVLYQLNDPYLRFWFRFVAPNQSPLQLEYDQAIFDGQIAPNLDEFVARTTWEEVCTQFLWRSVAARTLPLLTNLGRWWDGGDEIDIVGMLDKKVSLIGECKWTNAPVDERTYDQLRAKARKLDTVDSPLWVLASRSGFTPGLRRRVEGGNVLLIGPEDLYSPELFTI